MQIKNAILKQDDLQSDNYAESITIRNNEIYLRLARRVEYRSGVSGQETIWRYNKTTFHSHLYSV